MRKTSKRSAPLSIERLSCGSSRVDVDGIYYSFCNTVSTCKCFSRWGVDLVTQIFLWHLHTYWDACRCEVCDKCLNLRNSRLNLAVQSFIDEFKGGDLSID